MLNHRLSTPAFSHARYVVFALVAATALVLTACTSPATGSVTAGSGTTAPAYDWSYSGFNGPDAWGKFGAACHNTEASHESPIAIDTAALTRNAPAGDAAPVVFHYAPAQFELENNGHTIEAVPTDAHANRVERDGVVYELQQFHFHASSEHTIDGVSTAAELHLVHRSDDGELLVIGVLLEVGAQNSALDELFAKVTDEVSGAEGEALHTPINPSELLPANLASAQYSGSLTTPPCTEGVQWNVFTTPATVSAEQLAEYTAVYSDNHRAVQPLHGRDVFFVPAD